MCWDYYDTIDWIVLSVVIFLNSTNALSCRIFQKKNPNRCYETTKALPVAIELKPTINRQKTDIPKGVFEIFGA